MSPLWHEKVMEDLQKKGNQELTQVYDELFQGLPKPNKSIKQKLKKTEREIQKRHIDRSLKPVKLDRVHIEKYHKEIFDPTTKPIFFKTGSTQKRDLLALAQTKCETQLLDSDTSSNLRITLGSTDLHKTMQRLNAEKIATNHHMFKSIDTFKEELKKQLSEKESVVAIISN